MKTDHIFSFLEEGWLEQMKLVLESNVIIAKVNTDTFPHSCGPVPPPSELDAGVAPCVLESAAM